MSLAVYLLAAALGTAVGAGTTILLYERWITEALATAKDALDHSAKALQLWCAAADRELEAVRLAQLADDLTDACPAHPEDPALLVEECPYCRLLVHLLGGPGAAS